MVCLRWPAVARLRGLQLSVPPPPASGPANGDADQEGAAARRARPASAHEVSLHGSRQAGLAPATRTAKGFKLVGMAVPESSAARQAGSSDHPAFPVMRRKTWPSLVRGSDPQTPQL